MDATNELKARLLKAGSEEEVKVLLGGQASKEEVSRVWQEVQHHRPAEDLEAVDDNELEAVSGGELRNYGETGCAASVEEGSWCWSDDWCVDFDVLYENFDPCPEGSIARGRNHKFELLESGTFFDTYKCKFCGKTRLR